MVTRMARPTQHQVSHLSDGTPEGSGEEPVPGEFDVSEPEELLTRVRDHKSSMP